METRSDAPASRENGGNGFRKQFGIKTLIFFILACIAVLLYLIVNIPALNTFFISAGGHLAPLVWGGIIAYLSNPVLSFYEYRLFRRIRKNGVRRGLSLTLTVLTLLGAIALVIVMIVPQLIDSITQLVTNFESYVNKLLELLDSLVKKVTGGNVDIDISSTERLEELMNRIYRDQDSLLNRVLQLLKDFKIGESTMSAAKEVVTFLKNFVLGLFIAFYILASKEKRAAQISKFRKAVFSDKADRRVTSVARLVDSSFGGYIKGTLIDSLLVAIQVFLLMTVLDVSSYNLLIATFVGITNIIPVFGPFLGAIPSFLIVLISNPEAPSKCIVFAIIILAVQQVDGNIILPKILGDNTGVSPLAVLIAITLCGSLWGIAGMVIGVPLFAVMLETVRRLLEMRLRVKGEPTETTAYYPVDTLADPERDMYDSRSGLRYRYEHGRLKPRVEALREKLRNRKHPETVPPPEGNAPAEDGENPANGETPENGGNPENGEKP